MPTRRGRTDRGRPGRSRAAAESGCPSRRRRRENWRECSTRSRAPVLQDGGDPRLILLPGRQLGREANVGAKPSALARINRSSLSWSIGPNGAEARHVCAIFLFFGRLMLAGQRLRPYPDPAEVIAAGEARRPDTWLKPDLPEQLDGALGEAACPWVDQQVGVPLDQQRLDAVPPGRAPSINPSGRHRR